jgi:hypothetical protein
MAELDLVANNADTSTVGDGSGTGGTSGSPAGTTVQMGQAGGLVFNITYDSSVSNAPAAFTAAIADVVDFYTSQFDDSVTINLDVGWGELDGQSLAPGALGENESYLYQFSYSQVRAALAADAKGSIDAAAIASLPVTNPTGGGTLITTTAEAKALGLASNSGLDGYVGFSSAVTYSFDPNDRAVAGAYDFIGVAEHEISEVMGRIASLGASVGGLTDTYTPLDLFRYSGPGQRQLIAGQTAYFSPDGGNTNLDNFNTNPSGDAGDWAASAGNDSYDAFSGSGTANTVSTADLKVLDAIGWDSSSASALSADGSTLRPSGSGNLVTNAGTWTFGSPAKSNGDYPILLNGQTLPGGAVELEVANSGNLYADNALGNWYEWRGSGWLATADPNETPSLSRDGSTLQPGGSGDLVTSAGTWAFGSPVKSNGNYPILLNGQTLPGGAVELEVANSGNLYADNALGSWYEWVNSSWAATTDPNPSESPDGSTLQSGGAGDLVTSAGTWTFGSPVKSNGNYPILLNGQTLPGGEEQTVQA